MLDVAAEVRAEWSRIEGEVMAAAVTRAVARVAVGKAIEGVSKSSDKKEVQAFGLILSLIAQITMTAADEPDTRSWETLPARLGLASADVYAVIMNVTVVEPTGTGYVSVFPAGVV